MKTTLDTVRPGRLTGISGIAVLLLAGAMSACDSGEATEAPAYRTVTAERRDLEITVEATGSVEPVREVEVKSKASGEILDLHAEIGDQVDPGTLLADIDPRDVRNAFEQAQADLEVARARLDIAESQRDRSEELLSAGVVTAEEHESKNLEYANARASLVKAETNLELADQRMGDATIEAPMSGTILAKDVEEGQVIQSASANISGGTTLFVMANLDSMRVRTLVDETDMGQVEAGMAASVQVEAYPDRTFEGVVRKVEPQAVVEQNVTMFPVIVHLDNRAGLLWPGMNAEVVVHVAREAGALTVPTNAVVGLDQGRAAAQVLGLDPEVGRLDREALQGLMASGGGPGPPGGEPAGPGADGERSGPAGMDPAARDSLRTRIQRGEFSRDSLAAPRSGREGDRTRRGSTASEPGGRPPAGPGPGGTVRRSSAGGGMRALLQEARLAFVRTSDGTLEPRPVRIGLSDWDYVQVVAGLEEGDEVAVIGAAQLQAQQDEFLQRIRERRGGPF